MRLVPDWKRIVRKAWSIRLAVLAAVLSGLEVILPMYSASLPRGTFVALSFACTCAALVARVVAQPKMRDGNK